MPVLVIEKGHDRGKILKITGDTLLAGRETTAQIRLADLMASRLHFKIDSRPDGYYIVDLESMNGTFVNGKKIKEKLLAIGDKIQVGETMFSFLAQAEGTKEGELIGQTIGGCQVIERVGRGGMGTVYKAKQLSLNRIVALKILAPELLKDKTFINLFVQEARSAAQLNHHNIVQVYDIGKFKEWYYFLMEFIPGGSLQELLTNKKKLTPVPAIKMMLDAAYGLEYAEKKGIVHRDIKPDNLMLGEDNRVKISDLGLAKNLNIETAEPAESASGGPAIFGTPHYIAPEQALGQPVDHRADIYSLGATFYRILTGVTPYSGNSIREIIVKKTREDSPSLKSLDESLPDTLCRIVEKMIKRNPAERYQKAGELIADLKNLLAQLAPSAAEYHVQPLKAAPAPKPDVKPTPARLIITAIMILFSLLTVFSIIRYYQTTIRPAKIKQPDNSNRPNLREEKAREEFNRLLRSEKNIDAANAAEVRQILESYRRIIAGYPDFTSKSTIQEKITFWENTLTGLPTGDSERENEALKKYRELIGLLEAQKSSLGPEEVNPFVRQTLDNLNQLKTDYADTAAATTIDIKMKQLTKELAGFNQLYENYKSLITEVKNQVRAKQFKKAVSLIDDFSQKPEAAGTPFEPLLRQEKEQLVNLTLSSFKTMMEEAELFIKQKKYESGRVLITKEMGYYDISAELSLQMQDKLRQIDELIEGQRLEEDSQRFFPVLAKALRSAQQIKFMDALNTLKLLKNQSRPLKTDYYSKKVDDYLNDIKMEREIIDKLKARIKAGKLSVGQFRNAQIKDTTGDVIITVKQENGAAREEKHPWESIKTDELYELIKNGWTLTPEDYIALGVLCMNRGGLTKEAKELFAAAHRILTDNPAYPNAANLSLIANDCIERNREGKIYRERETETQQFLTLAETFMNQGNYTEALNNLLLLQYRYQDTRLYRQKNGEISNYIIKCEKNK